MRGRFRRLRLYAAWLALPVLGLGLAAAWEVSAPSTGPRAVRELDEAGFSTDRKLSRTILGWGQAPGGIAPVGAPGLSIEILIREEEWAAMRLESNLDRFRDERREALLRFEGGPAIRGTYRLRGQTSLRQAYAGGTGEKLNLAIRLGRSLPFTDDVGIKRFHLQNMIFDPYHYEMRFCYTLLAELGLFPSYSQMVDVTVNGRLLGVYLLVERPEDAIRRAFPAVESIHRRLSGDGPPFRAIYGRTDRTESDHLARLERLLGEASREELVAGLEGVLDLEAYLTWLAFNSLLRNADSYDEVYFYLDGSSGGTGGRLRVAAWDYDDIRARAPAHPDRVVRDPLLFGSEGELDRRIQAEPLLYARFRRVYRRLLEERLTRERIDEVTARVLDELDGLETGLGSDDEAFRRRRAREILAFRRWLVTRRAAALATLDDHEARAPNRAG